MTDVLDNVLRELDPADRDDIAGLVMLTPNDSDLDVDMQATGHSGKTWLVLIKRTTHATDTDLQRAAAQILTVAQDEPPAPGALTYSRLLAALLVDTARANWTHATRGLVYDHLRVRPDLSAARMSKFLRGHAVPTPGTVQAFVDALVESNRHWHTQLPSVVPPPDFDHRTLWRSVCVVAVEPDLDEGPEDPASGGDYLEQMHRPPTPEQARRLSARINAPDAASRKLPPRR
ncbi:hypothetical protein ACFWXO_31050 [Kitasatospora sp. NPDC059088]|uniref:hypothetical protein n=1 Tax=Kitasatospora sp. NPDC059088 TaxID=3346722 RepID=UPI0036B91E23